MENDFLFDLTTVLALESQAEQLERLRSIVSRSGLDAQTVASIESTTGVNLSAKLGVFGLNHPGNKEISERTLSMEFEVTKAGIIAAVIGALLVLIGKFMGDGGGSSGGGGSGDRAEKAIERYDKAQQALELHKAQIDFMEEKLEANLSEDEKNDLLDMVNKVTGEKFKKVSEACTYWKKFDGVKLIPSAEYLRGFPIVGGAQMDFIKRLDAIDMFVTGAAEPLKDAMGIYENVIETAEQMRNDSQNHSKIHSLSFAPLWNGNIRGDWQAMKNIYPGFKESGSLERLLAIMRDRIPGLKDAVKPINSDNAAAYLDLYREHFKFAKDWITPSADPANISNADLVKLFTPLVTDEVKGLGAKLIDLDKKLGVLAGIIGNSEDHLKAMKTTIENLKSEKKVGDPKAFDALASVATAHIKISGEFLSALAGVKKTSENINKFYTALSKESEKLNKLINKAFGNRLAII